MMTWRHRTRKKSIIMIVACGFGTVLHSELGNPQPRRGIAKQRPENDSKTSRLRSKHEAWLIRSSIVKLKNSNLDQIAWGLNSLSNSLSVLQPRKLRKLLHHAVRWPKSKDSSKTRRILPEPQNAHSFP